MPRVKQVPNSSEEEEFRLDVPRMLQDAKEEWRESCEYCRQQRIKWRDYPALHRIVQDTCDDAAKIQRHVIFTHLMPFLKSIEIESWPAEENLLSQLHLDRLYQCFDGASCEDTTNGFTFNILEFIEVNIDGVCNLTESILNDDSSRNLLQQLEVGDCMTDTTEQSPFHVRRIL